MGFKSAITEGFLDTKRKEAYKEFLEREVHKDFENFEYKPQEVIISVFYVDEGVDTTFNLEINNEGDVNTVIRPYPIAKIMAVGADSEYKVGDIVKLEDYQAASMENPKYAAYKSGMVERPVGGQSKTPEPFKYTSNLATYFGDKVFFKNPLAVDRELWEFYTFKVHKDLVGNKIKNPHAYLD